MSDSALETTSNILSAVIMIVALVVWILKGKKIPGGAGNVFFYILFIGVGFALSMGIHWVLQKIIG